MKNEKLSDQQLLTVSGSALYGARWQTELARDLGLSDGRRVRQWLSGDRSVPIGVWRDIDKLINEHLIFFLYSFINNLANLPSPEDEL